MALCLGDLMEGVLKAKRLIAFVEDMLAVDWDGESPSVITRPLNKTCREFQVPLWLLLNYYQRTCAERFRFIFSSECKMDRILRTWVKY